MKVIEISTGRPYLVTVGKGLLPLCGQHIKDLPGKNYSKIALISDSNVFPLYGGTVLNSLANAGYDTAHFVFDAGETSKTMETTLAILGFLAENGMTRSDLVIALGGGVTGDMAGFAASIYQRGIDFAQIPTTLLAAVDSSVGGKTAVNIPQGKNMVGAFWQPVCVYCDTDTFATLSSEVFADGMGEIIKHGCILDKDLFDLVATGRIQDNLVEIIARNVEIKASVVKEDERELGLRQILNFGHTIGHAIEKCSGFTLAHGKAVAMGMLLVAQAGEHNGITQPGCSKAIQASLLANGLPAHCPYPIEELCEKALNDKKRSGKQLSLIVLEEIGSCRIHTIPASDLLLFMTKGVCL